MIEHLQQATNSRVVHKFTHVKGEILAIFILHITFSLISSLKQVS